MPLSASEVTSIITATAAIVGPVAVAIVSVRVASREIRARLREAHVGQDRGSRKEWIAQLREALAAFLAAQGEALLFRDFDREKARDSVYRLSLFRARIELMLNPNEAAHVELAESVSEAFKSIWRSDEEDHARVLFESRERVVLCGQKVLKEAWDRISVKSDEEFEA